MHDVQAAIFAIIAETANISVESVESTTTISALGVASLDAIEMLFRIEEKFEIQLNDRDVDLKEATAGMLVEAVERALHKPAAVVLATPAG